MTDVIEKVEANLSDVQARIAALKKKGEEEAVAQAEQEQTKNWNKTAEAGDMLAGTLVRGSIVAVKGREEPSYLIEVKEIETGDLYTVWCTSMMLKRALLDKAPAPGSLVVVQYHGKEVSQKSGRKYHVFTLEAETADFDYWGTLARKFMAKEEHKRVQAAAESQEAAARFGPDEAPF